MWRGLKVFWCGFRAFVFVSAFRLFLRWKLKDTRPFGSPPPNKTTPQSCRGVRMRVRVCVCVPYGSHPGLQGSYGCLNLIPMGNTKARVYEFEGRKGIRPPRMAKEPRFLPSNTFWLLRAPFLVVSPGFRGVDEGVVQGVVRPLQEPGVQIPSYHRSNHQVGGGVDFRAS